MEPKPYPGKWSFNSKRGRAKKGSGANKVARTRSKNRTARKSRKRNRKK